MFFVGFYDELRFLYLPGKNIEEENQRNEARDWFAAIAHSESHREILRC